MVDCPSLAEDVLGFRSGQPPWALFWAGALLIRRLLELVFASFSVSEVSKFWDADAPEVSDFRSLDGRSRFGRGALGVRRFPEAVGGVAGGAWDSPTP